MYHKHPVEDLIAPAVDALGFEIVRVLTTGNVNPTLQIMIERKDRKDIVVEDCATVSRAVSEILDEKDPIDGQYSLEVSSPGLDRPLTKPEHFKRFCGYEVKIDTSTEINGRKRLKGKMTAVDDNNDIHLSVGEEEFVIPYEAVNKAKLVITDELWEEYAKAHPEVEL